MYNIKQAAARAGVTVPVLRAWERRYGIVHPARSAGGYRQFDDVGVARVRAMRALVDDGWSPSNAAAAILSGEVPTGLPSGSMSGSDGGPPEDLRSVRIPADEATSISDRLVDAARNVDPDATAAMLDDLFSRGSFELVATDLLFPALIRLGEAWESGAVSVAGEHLVSSATLRRLGTALEAAGSAAATGNRIVVGLPPGARHEIGVLAFAVAARRAGILVTYLGTDLPIDDWVAATAGRDGAVIGAVVPRDRIAALAVARRLRATYSDLVVAFGGRSAPPSSEFLRLPIGLTHSVATIRDALKASGRARG